MSPIAIQRARDADVQQGAAHLTVDILEVPDILKTGKTNKKKVKS